MSLIYLTDSLCPIFKADDDGDADFEGSSVLLKIHNRHFLITAAHVRDASTTATLYVPGEKQFVELGPFLSYSAIPPGGRNADTIDVAVCALSEAVVAELSAKFVFAPVGALNLSAVTTPQRLYTFSGFPGTKVNINRKLRKTRSRRFTYTSIGLNGPAIVNIGLDPRSHVVLGFDRKHAKDETGRGVTPPKVNGMSGGAVWVWPRGSTLANMKNPRLTAICIEHRKNQHVLVAVNIEFALMAIIHDFPELRGHVPASTRINVRVRKIDG